MLVTWLLEMFVFLVAYISTLLCHEAGHYVSFRWITGRSFKFRIDWKKWAILCGEPRDYVGIPVDSHIVIAVSGVLAGIPVLFAYASYSDVALFASVPLVFFYFSGCRADIRIIRDLFAKLDVQVVTDTTGMTEAEGAEVRK